MQEILDDILRIIWGTEPKKPKKSKPKKSKPKKKKSKKSAK